MKAKIKQWSLLSAFVLMVLCTISLKALANVEQAAEKYNTENCEYFLEDGSSTNGSRCYPPDALGPCAVRSNCRG